MATHHGGPRLCGIAHAAGRRAERVRELDRASSHGRQSAACRFSLCAVRLRLEEHCMNAPFPSDVIRQHLIDPEICIRCNTCEETCPVDAVTHDARNYVVDVTKCNGCNECIAPCPTGAIDNWRSVQKSEAYTLEQQLSWDTLPPQQEADTETASSLPNDVVRITALATSGQGGTAAPPWSA